MSIATCPKCHRQVSLPTTDDHSAWVRCPLCHEQYSLGMALDHVPPMLEIVGPLAGAEMAVASDAALVGELPGHEAMAGHGGIGSHGEIAAAHGEQAVDLAPLDAQDFLQGDHGDHGANGDQTIDFKHAAATEHLREHPPGLDQVNGHPLGAPEHLADFDLDVDEHRDAAPHSASPEHVELLEDDAAAAAFGEFQGEHKIEPSQRDPDSGELAGEGDPEFRFADGEAGEPEADAADEEHAMGGIATLVQSAPPARKRRQAPLMVKLIGVLLGLGFGLLGCYLVYGAFLWMHSDQFHLKQYFPAFLRNRVADEPAPPPRKKTPERLSPGSNPAVTPPAGTADGNAVTPPAPSGAPDTGTNAPPKTGDNPIAVTPPKTGPSDVAGPAKTPSPTDLAQNPPVKPSAGIETTEDPLKTPPPDLDKPNPSKTDPSDIVPPKFDPPVSPFGDTKPPKVDPNAKPNTDKPVTDKPTVDKPENPAVIPSTDKPVEKVTDKPVINPPLDKPADIPVPTPEPKSPIAGQLDDVDAAMKATSQTSDSLKSAAVPGAPRATVLKASVANYKAMSHLVTELGAFEASGTDPDSAARIDQLRKKAAAMAESMGAAAERDTTAMLASKWVASPSRKENGAVVVGTLVKVEPSDKGFVARIKLPSDSKEMKFTTTKKPTAADGSTVVVLGLLNADDGGEALEIVSPNDEKLTDAPNVDPSPKPVDNGKPSADKPSTDKPAADKPATDKPATDKPIADKPSTDKPAVDKPAADKPATDAPVAPPSLDKVPPEKPAAAPEPTKPQ